MTKSNIYLWFLETRNTKELPQSNKRNLQKKKKSQHYTYDDERLNTVLLRLGFRQEYLLSTLMLNINPGVSQDKETKGIQIG